MTLIGEMRAIVLRQIAEETAHILEVGDEQDIGKAEILAHARVSFRLDMMLEDIMDHIDSGNDATIRALMEGSE